MEKLKNLTVLTLIFILASSFALNDQDGKIRILLMGDSTTAGGKEILGSSIEALLAAQGAPNVEVINVGRGGETAYELIHSGRYEKEIKDIKDIDYIFFRYGINDYNPGKAHRKDRPFEKYFKEELREAISQVENDFPEAKLS